MDSFLVLAIVMLIIFISVVAIIGIFVYLKIARRSKDVERSLKLIPLLLKIPPQESGDENRDVRDLVKENISKAEGFYRLLS